MRCVESKGSFRDVGRAVGVACRSGMRELYERVTAYLLETSTAGSLARMRATALDYSKRTDRSWKPATAFLRGLADGSGMAFEEIAVIAYSEEIASEFQPVSKCSTLVVPTARGPLVGHNEDYEPHYLGQMVLLDATFDGFGRCVGLTYPGQLPNLAGSLNVHGVAITNNSLWPDTRPGLSKQVQHFRASLAKDLEEAVEHLAKPPIALTTHYTVAHGPTGSAVSLEVAGRGIADETVSLATIGPEPFCHTNHVRSLRLKERDPALDEGNSPERLAKLERLARTSAPRTPEALLDLLAENDGVLHRTPAQSPRSVTLATVAIRPQTGEFWVRDADPDAARRDWHFVLSASSLD